ncbi:MAG: ECF transporter S component, partial [Clostridiales bacterium]|nr:ECF transporter S component [Clostridiales bacterium]
MRKGNISLKKTVSYALILAAGPLLVLLSGFLFAQKQYALISVLLAFAACIPFFLSFEKKNPAARQTVLIAVMVALS